MKSLFIFIFIIKSYVINYETVRELYTLFLGAQNSILISLQSLDLTSVILLWEYSAQHRERWIEYFSLSCRPKIRSSSTLYTPGCTQWPLQRVISGCETDSIFLCDQPWRLRNIIQTWFTRWNWFCCQVTSLNFLAESSKQGWTHWFQRLGHDAEGPLRQTRR